MSHTALVVAYGDMIRRVSGEVARQYAAREGYEVVTADDVEQAVHEQFLKSGMTAEELRGMDNPQGYIRQTARYYGAANQARAARRSASVDFTDDDETPSLGAMLLRTEAARTPGPEEAFFETETIATAREVVETILGNIESANSREVARLFYLEGHDSVSAAEALDSETAAVRKALQRARDDIGPEADASLRAWRVFAHPGAKRPQAISARPTALIRAVV